MGGAQVRRRREEDGEEEEEEEDCDGDGSEEALKMPGGSEW